MCALKPNKYKSCLKLSLYAWSFLCSVTPVHPIQCSIFLSSILTAAAGCQAVPPNQHPPLQQLRQRAVWLWHPVLTETGLCLGGLQNNTERISCKWNVNFIATHWENTWYTWRLHSQQVVIWFATLFRPARAHCKCTSTICSKLTCICVYPLNL